MLEVRLLLQTLRLCGLLKNCSILSQRTMNSCETSSPMGFAEHDFKCRCQAEQATHQHVTVASHRVSRRNSIGSSTAPARWWAKR